MILSQKCVYGLRAIMYVAQNNDDGYVSIKKISDNLNISFHFLTKILQVLTQNKIMESYRGPNGGVNLIIPANKITILEIVQLIDGVHIFHKCILGLPTCDDKHPCPLHDQWTFYCQSLKKNFSETTIENLVYKIKESNLRISGG
jgi:Rrf2 family protein